MKKLLLFLVLALVSSCSQQPQYSIYLSPDAGMLERLAAKEIRRYVYLCSDTWLPIQQLSDAIALGRGIMLLTPSSKVPNHIQTTFANVLSDTLADQQYRIVTVKQDPLHFVLIRGGDSLGALYGAYRYIETLGVRFYLHGDIVPEEKTDFKIADLDIYGSPQFNLRGVQPFHDFPEGPDWWSLDDYKAVVTQLAKMRMNFLGFHTYPSVPFAGSSKPEPMVWHGTADQVNDDGTVTSAYPVLHFYTGDSTWGYHPTSTQKFKFGAAQLFEVDDYGPEYMRNRTLWPHTPEENIDIFNQFGAWQKDVFHYARRIGVKTCIGTETPLHIPESLQQHLRQQGVNPATERATRMVYEGTFERINRLFPLDYYWFWTPEYWTWQEVPDRDVERTQSDLLAAYQAAENVGASYTLATCGWVLGPPKDRAQFDNVLPKDMPFSCINREVGFTPVDSNFKRLERPAWAISWLEDDPALISPQLWVGRVRRDAVDAHTYGCEGFMGIHWRTQILSPMFAALAQSGWQFGEWRNAGAPGDRDLPVDDFYQDWARAQFGEQAGERLAEVFIKLDGGPLFVRGENERQANLYRTSDWQRGPGAILVNEQPWSEVQKHFDFLNEFKAVESLVSGEENKERYHYWLRTFEFAKQSAYVGCLLGELDTFVENAVEKDEEEGVQFIKEQILPLRQKAATEWGKMVTLLLETVHTPGALGTIANLEQHNLGTLERLTRHDSTLTALMDEPLSPLPFWDEYRGPARLIIPTRRTVVEAGEDFRLTALVLSSEDTENIIFHRRPLAGTSFQSIPFDHLNRSVYQLVVPASEIEGDFEYYVEARTGDTELRYPLSQRNHSVVVW